MTRRRILIIGSVTCTLLILGLTGYRLFGNKIYVSQQEPFRTHGPTYLDSDYVEPWGKARNDHRANEEVPAFRIIYRQDEIFVYGFFLKNVWSQKVSVVDLVDSRLAGGLLTEFEASHGPRYDASLLGAPGIASSQFEPFELRPGQSRFVALKGRFDNCEFAGEGASTSRSVAYVHFRAQDYEGISYPSLPFHLFLPLEGRYGRSDYEGLIDIHTRCPPIADSANA